jgi:hypothetical protein
VTTIAQERTKWNAVSGHPTMRTRNEWGAKRSYTDSNPVDEPATRIFIHITITNPSNYSSYDRHAQAVEAIGISRFPNTGISYNRLFMAGSTVVREGQPIGRRGAHTVNDFKRSDCSTTGCPGRGTSITAPNRNWNLNYNARSYVICQNVGHSVPDAMVDLMARAIVTDYRAGFITLAAAHNLHGHRCVSAKSCPANQMWAKMGLLHTKIHHYIDKGLGPTPLPPQESWFDMADEAMLRKVFREEFKNQLSVSGLVEDTLPKKADGTTSWNTSPFYLAAYAATAASPIGRQRQAQDTWNRVNPTLNLQYGTIIRQMLAIVQAIAKVDGISTEQVAEITTAVAAAVRAEGAEFGDQVADRFLERVQAEGVPADKESIAEAFREVLREGVGES